MPHRPDTSHPSRQRRLALLAAGVLAALALVVSTGFAAARTFALAAISNATVRDTAGHVAHESIVGTSRHLAVYWLTGDSRNHPECTSANGCLTFWPPVTTRSAHPAKPSAVHGRLTTWRHAGIVQLVLDGHPLYRYAGDSSRNVATGEGIVSFGGTWHVVRPSGIRGAAPTLSAAPRAAGPAPSTGSTMTPTPSGPLGY